MAISFDASKKIFKLDTSDTTYALAVHEAGYLFHLYYGPYLPDNNLLPMLFRGGFASFHPNYPNYVNTPYSPDITPSEYSCNGTGDFRISALQIRNVNGDISTDIRYVSHRILTEKPALCGLPSLRSEAGDTETLEITARDHTTGAVVKLYYTVYLQLPVMTRSVVVENDSQYPMDLERVYSTCLELPGMDYDMVHLYGQWFKERTVTERPLAHGMQSIQSKRGSSSHNHNPFVALKQHGTTEENGPVYGINLIYSGNFAIDIEVDARNTARVLAGINPTDFNWHLEPGESFTSPEAVMVFTDKGVGEMSRIFHRTYMKHLIKSPWRDVERPVLINSWEAAYFDFDDDKLVAFAHEAAKMGVDMLVMDDGWFGVRNLDNCSLGDWYVNEKKLKGGLSKLIERVNAEGLKFGIWYEPEMISPDSDLYRAHPDWCLHVKGRENSPARLQYVLDMSREDVRDNIFNQMSAVLANNKIDYVKWDFNRNLTEAGSALLPANRQKEIMHRFVLGTYDLMNRFVTAFPHILFENCSGGGGRFDPGMLYYSPQIWCSDNTDAIERLTIQFGSSMCYPVSTFGAHVAARPRTPLSTRANVAMCGTFGYELDPRKLTEDEKEQVRAQIADYRKYNKLIREGDLYRLIAPTEDHFRCAWQFVSPDKQEALVTSVIMRRPETAYFMLKLRGLDPNKMYTDTATGEVYSGALLMYAGINLTEQIYDDGESIVKYFKAE
ncbi:MAG: alpha-galactosidase [Clostridia bacterium]|nr:alpha-galactosidase [Clostridia bacterium]